VEQTAVINFRRIYAKLRKKKTDDSLSCQKKKVKIKKNARTGRNIKKKRRRCILQT